MPETSITELRRIEREIGPEDAVFRFDLRAGCKSKKSDATVDRLVDSILRRHQGDLSNLS